MIFTKFVKWLGQFFAVACTVLTLAFAIILLDAPAGTYWMGGWAPPFGIVLVLDSLSKLLLLTVNAIAFFAVVYAVSYMTQYTSEGKFYALFMLMLAGMNGVVLTGDLFNLFVFLEVASLASYALVGFGVEHEELEAGFKYLILGSLASTAILFGIAFIYNLTGTVNMADAARFISHLEGNRVLLFAAGLFIFGFGLKAGLVPFHAWLPDAHPSAPAPISAMLSGVLIKALGVYSLTRVVYTVLGAPQDVLAVILWLGVLTAFVGGIMSLGQRDLKRMLAFSSVSQVGYMAMGLGVGTPLGIAAALFHLFNHAIFKGLLFLSAGSIEHATGTRDLRQMGGLMKKLPVTSISTLTGSLSIAGIPPFNGFWSKLLVIIALIQAKAYVAAAVAIVVSFITLAYYAILMRSTLFGPLPSLYQKLKEASFSMLFSLVSLAAACLLVGLFYNVFMNALFNPAAAAVLDQAGYISMIIGG